jgi:hypothetical protein
MGYQDWMKKWLLQWPDFSGRIGVRKLDQEWVIKAVSDPTLKSQPNY